MSSREIRETFLKFFKDKQHKIVPSSPIVVKDDPTLMFINAGMNQFKDVFLGNKKPTANRVADTQKCLRVSGKHNDLEEVGIDTYHHTMFEMLGNWSFGDYFKKEAIEWAWELLTEVYGIDKSRLYATVFEGDKSDGVLPDVEAETYWANCLDKERILRFSKKDNFWEMGETGPCGPCSELHIDLRDDEERERVDGATLVNADHPEVIEIWNLVFIQYNRDHSGKLSELPQKHVDTGMGFERLCVVLQNKKSNYDTDVFVPLLDEISSISRKKYGDDQPTDIAFRVIADHVRAVAFTIADGQLPGRDGAGYVVRRILRRAIRYGYSFLNQHQPFIYKLISILVKNMGDQFPEIEKQQELLTKVIKEEEENFLRTLEKGIGRLNTVMSKHQSKKLVPGDVAFELFDTYGFPIDLTSLLARENGFQLDEEGFEKALQEQKDRSRQAAVRETDDWVMVNDLNEAGFVGYDSTESNIHIIRYRKVKEKDKSFYQMVFDKTPFYPEGGGQVGDTGYIQVNGTKISIIDTKKENDLVLHFAKELPEEVNGEFEAVVNAKKRINAANNHSATHLLHQALRAVLGDHVEQKGSLVHPDYLRFDFSHFQKMTEEEVGRVEEIVNEKVRENLRLEESRNVPIEEAKAMGAMSLFGEKYGEEVRVIKFGNSIELCGGTHVSSTGQISLFKILSESGVAAGVRRIEAVTGEKAMTYINDRIAELEEIAAMVKNKNVVAGVASLVEENKKLQSDLSKLNASKAGEIKDELIQKAEAIEDVKFIAALVELEDAEAVKNLAFQLKNEVEGLFLVLGAAINGKPHLTVMIDEQLVQTKGWNAGAIIRELAKEIQGGGGGQPFYATAGGKNVDGLAKAIEKAKEFVN